jgi:allantoinase
VTRDTATDPQLTFGAKGDTAVVGGTLVTEGGVGAATVLVGRGGTIKAILDPACPLADVKIIDATNLLVFPGGVDPHAHLNDPGITYAEDFYTGTSAAAAGGFTTVLEMPQTVPLVTSSAVLLEKLAEVRQKAVVDFGLWAAVTRDNADDAAELRALAEAGVIALKAFTSESSELPRVPDSMLAEALSEAAGLGLVVGVHCETQAIVDLWTRRLQAEGRNDPRVNSHSRPAMCEIDAVRRVLALCGEAGSRVHLVHLSQPEAVLEAIGARRHGVDASVETCVHYLTFTEDRLDQCGAFAMCNPPLRNADAVEGMWRLVQSGEVDCIGSDVCAYSDEDKATKDFWSMPAGINGIQIAFPLFVGRAMDRGLPLPRIASLTSGNAARRFGLYPRKGALLPGSDADMVMVAPRSPWRVEGRHLLSKSKGTAYEGVDVAAAVVCTLVRGRVVYDSTAPQAILAEPGYGRFLTPLRTPSGAPLVDAGASAL